MNRMTLAVVLGCFNALAADIPQGTHLLLRMENSINTRTAQEGDYAYMRTESPITAEGRIIVPTGSYVQGIVTQSKRSGRVSGRAQLGIRIDTLTLASGKVFKISPHVNSVDGNDTGQTVDGRENTVKQGGTKGQDAKQIAILAGGGASIGGLADRSWKGAGIGAGVGTGVGIATALLTRGREVELRRGTSFDVVFDRPITLD
jgi:hypothetical protein